MVKSGRAPLAILALYELLLLYPGQVSVRYCLLLYLFLSIERSPNLNIFQGEGLLEARRSGGGKLRAVPVACCSRQLCCLLS